MLVRVAMTRPPRSAGERGTGRRLRPELCPRSESPKFGKTTVDEMIWVIDFAVTNEMHEIGHTAQQCRARSSPRRPIIATETR